MLLCRRFLKQGNLSDSIYATQLPRLHMHGGYTLQGSRLQIGFKSLSFVYQEEPIVKYVK